VVVNSGLTVLWLFFLVRKMLTKLEIKTLRSVATKATLQLAIYACVHSNFMHFLINYIGYKNRNTMW